MCHCRKTMQVSSICVFLPVGGYDVYGGGTMRCYETGRKIVAYVP